MFSLGSQIKQEKKGRGYRNGRPFPEDWHCAWSNEYPFVEAANRPRGNGVVPGSQHGPRNRYAPCTDCRFLKSVTQLGEPKPNPNPVVRAVPPPGGFVIRVCKRVFRPRETGPFL